MKVAKMERIVADNVTKSPLCEPQSPLPLEMAKSRDTSMSFPHQVRTKMFFFSIDHDPNMFHTKNNVVRIMQIGTYVDA